MYFCKRFMHFSVKCHDVMRTTPFDAYKKRLAESILHSEDYNALEDRIMEAQWEIADAPVHETKDETMIAILRKSHAEGLAGKNLSMDQVESLVNQKIYELTHRMDAICAAEPA